MNELFLFANTRFSLHNATNISEGNLYDTNYRRPSLKDLGPRRLPAMSDRQQQDGLYDLYTSYIGNTCSFIGTTEHEDGRLEFWPALSAGSPFTSNPSAPTYYGTPGVCTGTEYGDPAPIFPFQDPGAWIEPSSQWRLQDDGSIVRGGPGEVDTLSTCPHASFNSSVFRPGIGGPAPPQLSSPSEVALRMRGNNGASPVDTRSFAPSQGRPIYPTGFLLEGNDGRFQELPLNEFEERVPSEELSEVRTQDAEGPSRLSTHVHDELVNLIKRRGTEITFEYVKDPKTGIAGWQPVQRGWVDESQ